MQCNPVFKTGILFITVTMLFFTACKKNNSNPLSDVDDNGGYASDISKMEWINNDVISIADAAGNYYNGVYMRTTGTTNTFGDCALVSTDTISVPHTLRVSFPSYNCLCLDGKNRRGSIIISYNGQYTDSNQIHTITYDNYFLNDQQLMGNVKVTRVDTTVIGDWYYKVKVSDTLVTTPNTWIVWQGNLVRKWLDGFATGDRSDNVYSISGGATLTRANGHIFACDIATPLKIAQACDYVETGVVNVTNTGLTGVRVLNYSLGTGGCDVDAQLNIGEHVYQIKVNQ